MPRATGKWFLVECGASSFPHNVWNRKSSWLPCRGVRGVQPAACCISKLAVAALSCSINLWNALRWSIVKGCALVLWSHFWWWLWSSNNNNSCPVFYTLAVTWLLSEKGRLNGESDIMNGEKQPCWIIFKLHFLRVPCACYNHLNSAPTWRHRGLHQRHRGEDSACECKWRIINIKHVVEFKTSFKL